MVLVESISFGAIVHGFERHLLGRTKHSRMNNDTTCDNHPVYGYVLLA
jgi:hypothetical protein